MRERKLLIGRSASIRDIVEGPGDIISIHHEDHQSMGKGQDIQVCILGLESLRHCTWNQYCQSFHQLTLGDTRNRMTRCSGYRER